VTTISPNSAPAGALAFTLTVNGSNFLSGSQVNWNGNVRTATFISSSQLQAHILAADLASPGKVNVTVVNPAPGGGSSGAATFTIAAETVVFQSSRALNGSDAAGTNFTANIWVMNPDGTGATALTKLTAAFADSIGPVWLRDGSKIAFASSRALDNSDAANGQPTLNIWIMNSNGSGATPVTKLTAGGADCDAPLWSPDGSKILFQSARALDSSDARSTNKVKNIWVVNPDGSGAIPLTKTTVFGADNRYPVWSPDGSKIVFFSPRALDGSDAIGVNSTSNIWLMNADGSGAKALTKLTAAGAHSDFPTWTPDGSKIVFVSSRALDGSDAVTPNGTRNVWLMNADGSGAGAVTKLTGSSTESAEGATASPDGSKIVFDSARALDGSDAVNLNGTTNIWVVNADGSGATPLTKITASGAFSLEPIWSPGGTQVFFSSQRALDGSDATNIHSTPNIWVVNANGSGAIPLTKITAQSAGSEAPQLP
jgi:Tol biopolymer transport system component